MRRYKNYLVQFEDHKDFVLVDGKKYFSGGAVTAILLVGLLLGITLASIVALLIP